MAAAIGSPRVPLDPSLVAVARSLCQGRGQGGTTWQGCLFGGASEMSQQAFLERWDLSSSSLGTQRYRSPSVHLPSVQPLRWSLWTPDPWAGGRRHHVSPQGGWVLRSGVS